MGTGKSLSSHENLMECVSFVRASENNVKGRRQKTSDFEMSVCQGYDSLAADRKTSDPFFNVKKHSGKAVVQKFKQIRKACLEYERHCQAAIAAKPTGSPTEPEFQRAVLACYNGVSKVSKMYDDFGATAKNHGKNLAFFNCYVCLKTKALWRHTSASIESVRATQSAGVLAQGDDDDESENLSRNQSSSEDTSSKQMKPEIRRSFRRPIGTKFAGQSAKQIDALQRGAQGLKALRNRVSGAIRSVKAYYRWREKRPECLCSIWITDLDKLSPAFAIQSEILLYR